MILGQSAATAAVLSIESELDVQSLPYDLLQKRLLSDGQVLALERSNILSAGEGIDPKSLSGVVVDDSAVKFSGEWIRSSSLRPFVGNSYYHDGNAGKGMRSAEFPFQVERNGLHEVRVSFLPAGNRAGEVKYVINSAKGKDVVKLDQRLKSNGDNLWHSLGSYEFSARKKYSIQVSNEDTEGFVIVDSARIIPLVLEQ